MSNYFCNDCKKAVDLKKSDIPELESTYYGFHVCKECHGTNWKAVIDRDSEFIERNHKE